MKFVGQMRRQEEEPAERRLVNCVRGEEDKCDPDLRGEYGGIERLRGLDGMSEIPKDDIDEGDRYEKESFLIGDGDEEMPNLEELVIEEEKPSGDEGANYEEYDDDLILPSMLRESIYEDEHVVIMEGGYREGGFEEDDTHNGNM